MFTEEKDDKEYSSSEEESEQSGGEDSDLGSGSKIGEEMSSLSDDFNIHEQRSYDGTNLLSLASNINSPGEESVQRL